jgi:site-specific recombinase XerD
MDHASIATQIYTNLHLEHLRDAVNAPDNKRMN